MPNIDDSDNPIKGFELVLHPEALYLKCRGRSCPFQSRMHRQLKLEWLLYIAARHRTECKRPVQLASSLPILPFDVIPHTSVASRQHPYFVDLVETAENATPESVIPYAYIYEGRWYCVPYGEKMHHSLPVWRGGSNDVADGFRRHCDHCGTLLKRGKEGDFREL